MKEETKVTIAPVGAEDEKKDNPSSKEQSPQSQQNVCRGKGGKASIKERRCGK